MSWRITPNTDSTDISQECLGLCATRDTFPRDVADHIHTNRGLHIQIRHNRDKQTFSQASDLSRLIDAAPDLLKIAKLVLNEWEAPTEGVLKGELIARLSQYAAEARAAIEKAEGRS